MNKFMAPSIPFKMRERTDGKDLMTVDEGCQISTGEPVEENPFRWTNIWGHEIWQDKKVVIFGLPGAFTPTCSTSQLPDFENAYDEIIAQGVDEVYCISVNDAFVMRKWFLEQGVQNVKFLADGNGVFTRQMGMLVEKQNNGMGQRSWRYAAVIDDMEVTWISPEFGRADNVESDPYEASHPDKVLEFLKSSQE